MAIPEQGEPERALEEDTPVEIFRAANRRLETHGLRWCRTCGPIEIRANLELLNRIAWGATVFAAVDAIKPLSRFSRHSQRKDGSTVYSAKCKPCHAARMLELKRADLEAHNANRREQYRYTVRNPQWRAKKAGQQARANRRRRKRIQNDPELQALERAKAAKRWADVKADPERYERLKEDRRLDYALRKDRQGVEMRPSRRYGPRAVVPVGLFREWLMVVEKVAVLSMTREELASLLDTHDRGLTRVVREGQRWVQVQFASRCVTRWARPVLVDGPIMRAVNKGKGRVVDDFGDLYGERVPFDVPLRTAVARFGDSVDGRVLPSVTQPDEEE